MSRIAIFALRCPTGPGAVPCVRASLAAQSDSDITVLHSPARYCARAAPGPRQVLTIGKHLR
jgi:hypothetical protein